MTAPATNETNPRPAPPTFGEALRFWWKLGWISFGGPAGQIAIMHREIVERRRWLSEDHFLHALNFCMLLPGPEAQQLATYLGWRLHGAKGGIAAGALFVIPSIFILMGLSWLYVTGANVAWINGLFYGLTAAVIAIVASAVKRIGTKALKTPALWALALASFIAIFFFKVSFVLIILSAALIGWLGGKRFPNQFPAGKGHARMADIAEASCVELPPPPVASRRRSLTVAMVCLTLWWLPILAAGWLTNWSGIHFQQGLFFSKAALVTVGGAYAVLPYVSQMAVEHHGWLTQNQMMAGLGLAETTPGPLIMVLQFVGFVSAWQHPGNLSSPVAAVLGALITTWSTFLPCFLFVFLGAPHVDHLRQRPAVATTLTAVTAAVVGVILNLAIWFSLHAIHPEPGRYDWFIATVGLSAWFAMERFKVGVIPVLGACAAFGMIWKLL
ncbi:chromate efflux transporter [Luteolibacter ambystomatis]|uniref:Chromate efflux transporter n=2 Tax=Luteolibacter ambystomatis TaxID=2824561 RepID=A0A975IZ04_9BACT|nr:chromate efflux transporter [Luteolibacter ambystomatis]QUE50777.1 chromate efflux transporter [Luteolibacter ambystomatis]